MPKKFQNKYRIETTRLQTWDYANNGAYFITICTKDRQHFFGEIIKNSVGQEMHLNKIGTLAKQLWKGIPNQFENIELGAFIIMPDHMHGIIIINDPKQAKSNTTPSILPEEKTGGVTGIKNPMFHQNISRIIRWYKGRCTFEMRKINSNFEWQSLFHDHIIRNADAFERIQQYIINNPKNWK